MTLKEIKRLLCLENPAEISRLYRRALLAKQKHTGGKVYLRGLIEFSNICRKNCYYCGIRKSNHSLKRYTLSRREIVRAALWAYKNGYGSVVLQSGENTSNNFVSFVERAVAEIVNKTGGRLAITLSCGEQTSDTYKKWFAAGARRYLLRIETSNPKLYAKLHPKSHSFNARLDCLKTLKALGYQTGTGIMIGLPGQTIRDIAADILFFRKIDADMLGMGPYIPHKNAPLAKSAKPSADGNFELGLKTIAAARLALKDVNIAAATALQALHPEGRELGLQAGANVIMPNITDKKYRKLYQLYEGKPCAGETQEQCKRCLEARIKKIGAEIAYFQAGDPPHYRKFRRGHVR